MHSFLFTSEKQIQIVGGGVNRAGSDEKANSKKPVNTLLKRGGEIAHEPEGHATSISGGDGAHEEGDDGGEERGGDDAAEKQRGAVDLAFAAAKYVDRGDGRGRAEKRAERRE